MRAAIIYLKQEINKKEKKMLTILKTNPEESITKGQLVIKPEEYSPELYTALGKVINKYTPLIQFMRTFFNSSLEPMSPEIIKNLCHNKIKDEDNGD